MSQLESQKRTIGVHEFEVFKLPPLTANDTLIDLGQILAPAITKAAAVGGQGPDSPLDLDIDDPRIASGISALAAGITKEKMRELIRTMADVSHCDGKPLPKVMDAVFRGDLPLMYRWLWFSLEVNFGNFTAWLENATGGFFATKKAARSQSTSSDTGQP